MTRPVFRVAGVVFDLDGVLIDSESANVESARQALAAFGVRMEPMAVECIVGRHPRDYLPELIESHGLTAVAPARLAAVQEQTWRRLAGRVPVMPGATRVVRHLAEAGFELAVATSSGADTARAALEALDLAAHFEVLLTLDDVRHAKPDPEIYRLAAERLALPSDRLAAIEDSPHGIAAARGAGLHCIALAGAWTPVECLAGADAVIDHLEQLPALLDAPALEEDAR